VARHLCTLRLPAGTLAAFLDDLARYVDERERAPRPEAEP